MEEKNINNTAQDNELLDANHQKEMEAKSQEIVKKLDKESATRKFTGKMARFFYIVCLLVSGYHLYTAAFGPPVTLVHRSIHVAMITAMGFLMYPCSKAPTTQNLPSSTGYWPCFVSPSPSISGMIIWAWWNGPATQIRPTLSWPPCWCCWYWNVHAA